MEDFMKYPELDVATTATLRPEIYRHCLDSFDEFTRGNAVSEHITHLGICFLTQIAVPTTVAHSGEDIVTTFPYHLDS